MNLQIATVLSCTEEGCQAQPIDDGVAVATHYSRAIIKHKIPIRPNQFVIIDTDPVPPETIFRWRRATVTNVEGEHIELDDEGQRLVAVRGANVVALAPGDEVVLKGYNDANRRVIDVVINGKPAHASQLAAEWFPQMIHYRA